MDCCKCIEESNNIFKHTFKPDVTGYIEVDSITHITLLTANCARSVSSSYIQC